MRPGGGRVRAFRLKGTQEGRIYIDVTGGPRGGLGSWQKAASPDNTSPGIIDLLVLQSSISTPTPPRTAKYYQRHIWGAIPQAPGIMVVKSQGGQPGIGWSPSETGGQ